MRLWRVSRHPGLTGVGGTYASGRWHAMPRPVVYAAEHPALAMVEVMAGMRIKTGQFPHGLRLIAIDVDDRAGSPFEPELPAGWQANSPMTQCVGNAWLEAGDTLLMRVPSAVLPHAFNVLLNPAHRDASRRVSEVDAGPFWFDARFLR